MIEINLVCGNHKWKETVKLGSKINEVVNTNDWNIVQKGWIKNDAVAEENLEIINIIPKMKGG